MGTCGIDIPEMDYIINYDLPDWRINILEARNKFIQRCGRIGRIENGTAISFYVKSADMGCASWLRKILQNAKQVVPHFLEDRFDVEASIEKLSLQ
uniref:Helicase C-terminal domain-containing protein n=1 Tax=Panagrolaimus davidi TaxID=227884 RepID=A0A914R1J0_9BILA